MREAGLGEIRAAVRDFLFREFLAGEDPDRLADDTPLVSGGLLDSIGITKLAIHLEETFGIDIDFADIGVRRMDSVERIVGLVREKRGA